MKNYVDFGEEKENNPIWDKESIIDSILNRSPSEHAQWLIFRDQALGYDLICIKNKHVSEEIVVGHNIFSERQASLVGRMYQIVIGVLVTQDNNVETPNHPWKKIVADSAQRLYKNLDME